MARAIK